MANNTLPQQALSPRYSSRWEIWEGSKEQLQSAGIGVSLPFPGEPGAPQELRCHCPLGFEVTITQKVGSERLFRAESLLLKWPAHPPTADEHFAEGVVRRRGFWSWEYMGTASALAAVGLVRIEELPGQPNRPKMQTRFKVLTGAEDFHSDTVLVQKRAKGRFQVSMPLTRAEWEKQREQEKREAQELAKACSAAQIERQQTRLASAQLADGDAADGFRELQSARLEFILDGLWALLSKREGALSLDLGEGSDARANIGAAYERLREAVQQAGIKRDAGAVRRVGHQKLVIAAKADSAVQALLAATSQPVKPKKSSRLPSS